MDRTGVDGIQLPYNGSFVLLRTMMREDYCCFTALSELPSQGGGSWVHFLYFPVRVASMVLTFDFRPLCPHWDKMTQPNYSVIMNMSRASSPTSFFAYSLIQSAICQLSNWIISERKFTTKNSKPNS